MGVWALASCRLASLKFLGGRKRCRVYVPSAQLAVFIGLFRALAPHVEPVFQDGASNTSVYATLSVVIILVANFQELPPRPLTNVVIANLGAQVQGAAGLSVSLIVARNRSNVKPALSKRANCIESVSCPKTCC